MQQAFGSAVELANDVNNRASGIEKCTIKFEKGTGGIDTALLRFSAEKKGHYFKFPFFNYYSEPSKIRLAYCFRKYYAHTSLFKPLFSTELGYTYRYD